jgi:hypothetical protein
LHLLPVLRLALLIEAVPGVGRIATLRDSTRAILLHLLTAAVVQVFDRRQR